MFKILVVAFAISATFPVYGSRDSDEVTIRRSSNPNPLPYGLEWVFVEMNSAMPGHAVSNGFGLFVGQGATGNGRYPGSVDVGRRGCFFCTEQPWLTKEEAYNVLVFDPSPEETGIRLRWISPRDGIPPNAVPGGYYEDDNNKLVQLYVGRYKESRRQIGSAVQLKNHWGEESVFYFPNPLAEHKDGGRCHWRYGRHHTDEFEVLVFYYDK